jgi:diadenosine tetraphosphate (Ap4A) HIT family hydrolase
MEIESCFICRKNEGLEEAPPGGFIYEDECWVVCHAPARLGPLGKLFIESKRHFLDYSEMTNEEAQSLGLVLRKVFQALRQHTDAERIYQLMTMEGVPHYHSWLVPRTRGIPERGLKFLARDDSCTQEDAEALAEKLRSSLL